MTAKGTYGTTANANARVAFVAALPELSEPATQAALEIVRNEFHRRPRSLMRALGIDCTTDYVRQLFTGHAPITLARFARCLTAITRESARAALQALGAPHGIVCSFADNNGVKDIKSEVVEAAAACGRVFVFVNDAIADGKVDDAERAQIDRMVAAAKAQLNDVEKALGA